MRTLSLILLVSIALISCSVGNSDPYAYTIAEIQEDYSNILNPRERWEAYDLSDYAIEQSWFCECYSYGTVSAFIVRGDLDHAEVGRIEETAGGELYLQDYSKTEYERIKEGTLTVEQAFKIIEQHQETAHSIEVSYHARFGYPTSVRIDPVEMMVDEEIIYEFTDLKRIIR